MRREMKKFNFAIDVRRDFSILVVGGCLALGALNADACTGFYVGKEVSADGTTLIGRTVDAAPWNGPMREQRFERGEWTHADGTKNKYAFICASKVTSQGVGFYGGGAINEKGVMLSETVTGRTRDRAEEVDPFKPIEKGGYGEANLPDLMIGNAATAREAVDILAAKISEKGHSGPEIYMVADTRETPAGYVARLLAEEHVRLAITDPKALANAKLDLVDLDGVSYEPDPYEAAKDADAVLLMTDWKVYSQLDWPRIYGSMRKPALVFDTRNCLDAAKLRALGFRVLNVGK